MIKKEITNERFLEIAAMLNAAKERFGADVAGLKHYCGSEMPATWDEREAFCKRQKVSDEERIIIMNCDRK